MDVTGFPVGSRVNVISDPHPEVAAEGIVTESIERENIELISHTHTIGPAVIE